MVVLLMGPTAANKTDLALSVCSHLPGEIISVDSAAVYRGMNIGTSKPKSTEMFGVPCHLVDIRDPAECYSAAEFCRDATRKIGEIVGRRGVPILVGGSMFYFRALLCGLPRLPSRNLALRSYITRLADRVGWKDVHRTLRFIDPVSADRIHPNDSQRISRAVEVYLSSGSTLAEFGKGSGLKSTRRKIYPFGVLPPGREILRANIRRRLFRMLSEGFMHEVNLLRSRGDLSAEMQSLRCIGYRQMWCYLAGGIDHDELVSDILSSTYRLARSQISWLRRWGDLHYLDGNDIAGSTERLLRALSTEDRRDSRSHPDLRSSRGGEDQIWRSFPVEGGMRCGSCEI